MDHYGFLSLLPPVIAIFLAIRTKQVFVALVIGIWLGYIILAGWNPFIGSLNTVQAMVDVFKDDGNTRTVIFTLFIGALIAFIQRSGGVEGFIVYVNKKMESAHKDNAEKKGLYVRLLAGITGMLIFVESNISVLTTGTLYRPLFDQLKISREKLAYICDSSSAPSCILIPFNAWGAYIMGLLLMQGFERPFSTLFASLPYNFYPLLAVAFLFWIIITNKDFGPMKKAETRARVEGKVIADGATPMISEEITIIAPIEGKPQRAINMLVPIVTMVVMMPIFLVYTGWGSIDWSQQPGMFDAVFEAIGGGSGSASVTYAVITSLAVAATMYGLQGIMTGKEMINLTLKGMSGMISMALLMVLAFAIGSLCKTLGTGFYVAEVTKSWLSPALVPAIVFAVSCFIAFSTGTSWGTFAIMISIAVPMAQSFGTDPHVAIAAALGGGVFGDHCSPISDTTMISSMASASDHIDHVRTQMPYALVAGGLTVVLYVIVGFVTL
jgi:tetracycline resistance efflux pump